MGTYFVLQLIMSVVSLSGLAAFTILFPMLDDYLAKKKKWRARRRLETMRAYLSDQEPKHDR